MHVLWVGQGLEFHTMFLLDLVSVFLYLAGVWHLMVSWAWFVFVRLCMHAWSLWRPPLQFLQWINKKYQAKQAMHAFSFFGVVLALSITGQTLTLQLHVIKILIKVNFPNSPGPIRSTICT